MQMTSTIDAEKLAHEMKDKYVLRFERKGQRAALKAQAALNRRSLNAEILLLIDRGQEALYGVECKA
jgi:hypothetical protein